VEQVSARCHRVLGLNPGPHTLHGTNTYLVGAGDALILIDTGEASTSAAWVAALMQVLLRAGGRITDVLLSHGHFDHSGGVTALLAEMERRGMPLPHVHKRRITADGDGAGEECGSFPARDFRCSHLTDGQEFTCPADNGQSTTLRCIYSPGHTDDSVCFALLEDFALLSGDSVLGCGTSVFDDLQQYVRSLDAIRLLMLCQPAQAQGRLGGSKAPVALHTIYPGHGPIVRTRALEHVDAYLENRQKRDRQLVAALSAHPDTWLSSWELVPLVYGPLPLAVRLSAQGNLLHHLQKLRAEGRVCCTFAMDMWGWLEEKRE